MHSFSAVGKGTPNGQKQDKLGYTEIAYPVDWK